MSTLAIGLALGFAVSIPPGPNSAACVSLASGGMRRAVPLITGAALTDAAYSLLAASGILIVSRADVHLVEYLVPGFLLITAGLSWSPDSIPAKAAAVVPVLNPATAAIWLGLSSAPALRSLSLSETLLRPVPVALGTATWFALLAAASAKVGASLSARQTRRLQKSVACLLGLAGIVSLGALFT